MYEEVKRKIERALSSERRIRCPIRTDAFRINSVEKYGEEMVEIEPFPYILLKRLFSDVQEKELKRYWIFKDGQVVAYRRPRRNDPETAFSRIAEALSLPDSVKPILREEEKEENSSFFLRLRDRTLGRCSFIAGAKNSGKELFLDYLGAENRIYLSGRNFQNSESLNAIYGSAPGYTGSDTPTRFAEKVKKGDFDVLVLEDIEAADEFLLASFVRDWLDGFFSEKTGKLGVIEVDKPLIMLSSARIDARMSLLTASFEEKWAYLVSLRDPVTMKSAVPRALLDLADKIWLLPNVCENAEMAKKYLNPVLANKAVKYKLSNVKIQRALETGAWEEDLPEKSRLVSGESVLSERTKLGKKNFAQFLENLKAPPFFGQEEAVRALQALLALRISSEIKRPLTAIFVGPPGVGKTELAARLGKATSNFVRIDANQLRDKSVLDPMSSNLFSGLQASTAGVVLIDEVEKLSNASLLELLQVLGEGRLTDPVTGTVHSLEDYIFLFTTNFLYEVDGLDEETLREMFAESNGKREGFPREFIDRMDKLVPFKKFTAEELFEIAKSMKEKPEFSVLPEEKLREIAQKASSIRSLKSMMLSAVGDLYASSLMEDVSSQLS